MTRVSIVTAVLDSPEMVRRQLLHYAKMDLPEDVEIVLVDDGSNPPLWAYDGIGMSPLIIDSRLDTFLSDPNRVTFLETNDNRLWTQPAARNFGVKKARGEYVLCTDIDHIVSREAIEVARTTTYDLVRFKREVGVIDVNGDFSQDWDVIATYGMEPRKSLRVSAHSNSFIIRRGIYLGLGGVSERKVGSGIHPNREELPLKKGIKGLLAKGEMTICPDDDRPTLYMIPNGRFCGHKDFNPFGLFHNLERKNG